MHYIGTQEQCEAYNQMVTEGKSYPGLTNRWANVIPHPNGTDFAILKNGAFESELTELETLGADWFPEELI
jgi:hypothetical protein